MSHLADFPKRPADFPMPTPISAEEVARLLWESNHANQNSRSPETKPPRRSRACTYLTRKETAKYLGMSPKTLENHPKHIPFYKFGGRVFYIKEELDTLIRRNRQEGAQ